MRLFKVHARSRGLTYSDALDEALCFGWIDGVRRTGDEDTFTRTSIFWVMSAKKEETRERRLAMLIDVSAKGKPLPQLDRTKS